jgi:histone H3/H4
VNAATESVPISLADTGEYGENVYDSAKAKDWNAADLKLGALRESARDVHTDVKNQSDATDSLDEHVAALGLAVAVKDRQTAMHEANRVTLDVANMTTAYKLSVPVDVIRLDYYGRELEIWAEAKDENNLQETAHEMRGAWDSVRRSVEARSAPEAKKFGALVAQVESAKSSSDYALVAPLVVDEVDNLEKLFQ